MSKATAPGRSTANRMPNFSDWNNELAAAVRAVGHPSFPKVLGEALQLLAPFHMVNAFGYDGSKPPIDLFNDPEPKIAQIIIDDYISGAYLLDPFFEAVRQGLRDRFLAMQVLAPDRFRNSEYFKVHYRKAEISDEAGYVMPLQSGLIAVLSITRRTGEAWFRKAELSRLQAVVPLVCALGEAHWNSVADNDALADWRAGQRHGPRDVSTIPNRLGGGCLTEREVEIVQFLLKGHSSQSAGLCLNISPATVKVHRKNIYRKLRIASQAELFALFMAEALA